MLGEKDVLVFNQTKVFPARLIGKKDTGGEVELLLLHQTDGNTWEAIYRGKLNTDQNIFFGELKGKIISKKGNTVNIFFNQSAGEFWQFLEKEGRTPLPPYISSKSSEKDIRKQYQTVYAKEIGSAAAPTAGFHFTNELLDKLTKKGVQMEYVTLHVGLGTFAPIKEEEVEKHPIHSEFFTLTKEAAERLNLAKKEGKKIIAVGTTTTRVLETCTTKNGLLTTNNIQPATNLFIHPPYKFKFVDALITNFHLPKSSLLALVSAFVSYPNADEKFLSFTESLIGEAYTEAVKKNYRFYSFGDASLII